MAPLGAQVQPAALTGPPDEPAGGTPTLDVPDPAARMQAMVADHFQFIWRVLVRLIRVDEVPDATQQTFVVAARKLSQIEIGRERAFLFKTALWVATHVRARTARRREVFDEAALDQRRDSDPNPEEALAQSNRRKLLDEVLDAMPLELRTVFVLFELEGMPTPEIASLVRIPVGTAASRLRRAREEFHVQARRVRARLAFEGEEP